MSSMLDYDSCAVENDLDAHPHPLTPERRAKHTTVLYDSAVAADVH